VQTVRALLCLLSAWLGAAEELEGRERNVALQPPSSEPPATAADPWEDPAMQRRIDERIERRRKGDASLILRDGDGGPVANTAVRIEMKRHHFKFGGGVHLFFDEGVLGKGLEATYHMRDPDHPRMEKHYVLSTRFFNHGTIPIYWQWIQRSADELDLRVIEEALAMHKRLGLSLEAHPRCVLPGPASSLPPKAQALQGGPLDVVRADNVPTPMPAESRALPLAQAHYRPALP
jgi:hypothetical protein